MSLTLFVNPLCVLVSIVCLFAGFNPSEYWKLALAFLALGLFWLVTRKKDSIWPASALLGAYILLAAAGMVAKNPPHLMLAGSVAALCSWDLAHFRQSLLIHPPAGNATLLEKSRLRSLLLAALIGLALGILGLYIRIQLPFGLLVLVILLLIVCLDRFVRVALLPKN